MVGRNKIPKYNINKNVLVIGGSGSGKTRFHIKPSKTSRAAAPLDAKPDLVKRIGNTTFDIHIHFSETSRETFTDKVVRLIENDKDSVTN